MQTIQVVLHKAGQIYTNTHHAIKNLYPSHSGREMIVIKKKKINAPQAVLYLSFSYFCTLRGLCFMGCQSKGDEIKPYYTGQREIALLKCMNIMS